MTTYWLVFADEHESRQTYVDVAAMRRNCQNAFLLLFHQTSQKIREMSDAGKLFSHQFLLPNPSENNAKIYCENFNRERYVSWQKLSVGTRLV